ncbi:hypothetical protein J503_0497 [Acinetobacter baumannii 984213]|nr:hypothetical protein J503_0497 [Acinetobacter baumannii 984213]
MAEIALKVPKFGLNAIIPVAAANNTRLIRISYSPKKKTPPIGGATQI